MMVVPMSTVVGNTVRVRVMWAGWDDNAPVNVVDPEVICFLGTPARMVDTLPMSATPTPGQYEVFWTPTTAGTFDLHATAMVDGSPEAAHHTVVVRP